MEGDKDRTALFLFFLHFIHLLAAKQVQIIFIIGTTNCGNIIIMAALIFIFIGFSQVNAKCMAVQNIR